MTAVGSHRHCKSVFVNITRTLFLEIIVCLLAFRFFITECVIFRGNYCYYYIYHFRSLFKFYAGDWSKSIKCVFHGYLATTSLLSVLLSITHKKRALYKISTSEHQNKCIYKWIKVAI